MYLGNTWTVTGAVGRKSRYEADLPRVKGLLGGDERVKDKLAEVSKVDELVAKVCILFPNFCYLLTALEYHESWPEELLLFQRGELEGGQEGQARLLQAVPAKGTLWDPLSVQI